MTETSPTAQRREVGTLLRAHRERVGLMLAEAAEQAGMSAAKLSRLERGLRGLQVADVRTLCGLYRLSELETRTLLASTRASREPGWWTGYSDLSPASPMYFGLEAASPEIWNFQALRIPGLLQTRDYAFALLARLRPAGQWTWPEGMINERVEARIRRQAVLASDKRFHFVVDEAALRRNVGSPVVMRAQIDHVVGVAALENVVIQVVPFELGPHPGLDGSFTLLRFESSRLPDVVMVEGLAGAMLIDSPQQVSLYGDVFRDLVAHSLSPADSLNWLAEIFAGRPSHPERAFPRDMENTGRE